jgi:phthiocerol/phenolphthiocerol synthesis type-I polyketide synthase E
MSKETNFTGLEIAIIGMAGRFPGAKNIEQFWKNLIDGKETISFFTVEELLEAGIDPQTLADPNYVKANGILEGIEYFDSSLFGYSDIEATLMDPQTRIFHECAWEGLEDAGYCPDTYNGLIGLYVGATSNFNWEVGAVFSSEYADLGQFSAHLLMNKDFICGWVSYKLDLKGPSFTMTTACSTSLVAIHEACQSILNGECDMTLAGGVNATRLYKDGYLYQEGMLYSPDGHLRAFDAGPHGVVGKWNGSGCIEKVGRRC